VEQALVGTGLTVPLRAVLEVLLGRGPMTVPRIAGEFGVRRQSVQALVDDGVAGGLLELVDNPEHLRSRLVAVTDQGRRTFADVHRRELGNLERVTADLEADGLDEDDLALCARVLAALTERVRRLHQHDQPAGPRPDQERT
jgi:DNA-binding MarR family transcriptional regulator